MTGLPARNDAAHPRDEPDGSDGVPGRSRLAAPHSSHTPSPVQRPAWRPIGAPLLHPAATGGVAGRQFPPRADETARNRPSGRVARLVTQVLINRDFRRLWTGQAISTVGDIAFTTALVLWIASLLAKDQAWAPLAVSGVILSAAVPEIVAGPIAGVFVDRWDKRGTMLRMNAMQAIAATLLLLATNSVPLPFLPGGRVPVSWQLGLIYADVALITIMAQFFNPAQFALIKDIVPETRQDQALETSQATAGLAIIIGPPVAALLVFGLGVGWALLLNGLSFVASYAAILAIDAPQSASSLHDGERGHFVREFLAGLRYVISHTVLRTILTAEVLTWLGFGALETLGYFFITENLHAPASYYGYLGADFGVGSIVGALFVTFAGQRIGLARILWVALITCGTFVIVMSHLTNFYLALGAAFLFGVSATAIIVTAGPLALHSTSREFVGRVTAVINPVGRLAALISVVVAGYLVSTVLHGFHARVLGITFGPVNSVFTGMGLLAVAGGIYARINLRKVLGRADSENGATH